jgi:hypothetical protein
MQRKKKAKKQNLSQKGIRLKLIIQRKKKFTNEVREMSLKV